MNNVKNDENGRMMHVLPSSVAFLNKEETSRSHPLAKNPHNRHNAHKLDLN